ncbi:MAG: DNA polymerase III subunit gamma/tau [Acidobacteria bacterium]|nr:DNA polymerase III subunit gamma/tau [Acidobacteriota bacterium]
MEVTLYQVIARTWRPQRFAEVIGQKHVTQTLQNAIRLDRIGHGYIFSGQRGVGKTTVARLLAKALNCHRGPAPEPCCECDACQEIAAGRAIDVIEIDAASNRGIDAVRELRETARYAPARDRYKVFIIDEAHQITPEGFNALLKTLEEPPSHVVFVLATTEVHQFPETILSRCQHFAFRAISFAEILEHLEKVCAAEKVEADSEALTALVASGEGSLRDALSRLEQAIAAFGSRLEGTQVRRLLGAAPSQLVEAVFTAVREQNRQAILAVVEQLVEEGYQLTYFCSQLVRTVRNLLVVRVAGPQQHLLETSVEEVHRLAALAESFSEESLMRSLEILLQVYQSVRYSMEPRFQMELGLLKLVDAERLVAIEDLLARLESGASPLPPSERTPVAPTSSRANPATATKQSPAMGRLSPFEQDVLRKKQTQSSGTLAKNLPEENATNLPAGSEPATENLEATTVSHLETAPAGSSPAAHSPLPAREEVWVREAIRRLEERSKPLLASLLADVHRWEFGETEVRIRLAGNGLAQVLPDSDRQLLSQLLEEVLGRKIKVSFVEEWKELPSQEPARRAKIGPSTPEDAAGVENRVRNDPEIQEFEKVFGKSVTGIRKWRG